jgi:hypothetical protein
VATIPIRVIAGYGSSSMTVSASGPSPGKYQTPIDTRARFNRAANAMATANKGIATTSMRHASHEARSAQERAEIHGGMEARAGAQNVTRNANCISRG